MDGTSETERPTGIPRPSRLPILSKRTSHYGLQSAKQPTITETPAKQRLTKRASLSVLSKSGRESPKTLGPVKTIPQTTSRPSSVLGGQYIGRVSSFKASLSGLASHRVTSSLSTRDEADDASNISSPGLSTQTQQEDRGELRSIAASYSKTNGAAFQNKSSRVSLSDRAIESIQAVPATPKDRRQSNFYNASDSPIAHPPRSTADTSTNNKHESRPGSSGSSSIKPATLSLQKARFSAKNVDRPSLITNGHVERTSSSSVTNRLQGAKSTSPNLASKPFTNGVTEHLIAQQDDTEYAQAKDVSPVTNSEKPLSGTGSKRVPSDSSTALRQQIAAAKAAMKKEREKAANSAISDSGVVEITTGYAHADPFNQAPKNDKHALLRRIKSARLDGKLNISGLGLKTIPEEVLSMYSPAALEESKVNWTELVDLTKFIAADNEIEAIDDNIFPDLSQEQLEEDDGEQQAQFGGIEMLDLHGNLLISLPSGLRHLERLTSLNLGHNRLDNTSLDVISEIRTLRNLKLGHNNISGNLPASITSLKLLEELDVQSNRLLALPESLRELTSLRVLNVSGNQLTALPMQAFSHIPLHELDASNNALLASLFPLGTVAEQKTLRTLNVANNSLAALTFTADLVLPALQSLDVTNNHLTLLPDVTSWTSLITLRAGDNKISELPKGFVALKTLKIANLSGNEFHILPPQIALMDSLTTLVLASNPLRHKKFLNMAAADIKNDLHALLPESGHRRGDSDDFDDEAASWGTAPEEHTFSHSWAVKAGGVLDLSNKGLTDSINDSLASFLRTNEVRHLNLRGNKLTLFPPALSCGQDLRVLDLSSNPLVTDYLADDLELPSLTELDLSTCRIALLEPLIDHLRAPRLHSVQFSGNRISGPVPTLRKTYVQLSILLASDNKFQVVTPEALSGLSTVDLTSNELQSLPAELGLLWDQGLRNLEVGRNAFRVPGHRVLEKGTQATLAWLKHRIKIDQADDVADA